MPFSSGNTVKIKVEEEIKDEPEEERNIRLGNSTAFGSILKSVLKSGGNFDSYLKQLQREQQDGDGSGDESKPKGKNLERYR